MNMQMTRLYYAAGQKRALRYRLPIWRILLFFDELVDSGLLSLDGCLTIGQVLGATLTKTSDSLCPLTADNVGGFKEVVEEEEPASEPVEEAVAADINIGGAVTTIKNGKVVISIKEGKDIYLELPV